MHVHPPRPRLAARRRGSVAAVVAVLATLVLGLAPASAQVVDPNQVQNLAVEQHDGFATLSWDPVAGATDYQIARQPVNDANVATGTEVQVGLWRPNRTTTPESPTFADAGFNPGDRFQWRVRARFGTATQPYSTPVFGTTLPPWGDLATPGESMRTQWETTLAAQYTSDVNEYAYTAQLDAMSDRVRVVKIAETLEGRDVNLFIIGYPAPPATAAEIANSPTALVNCNVHGNEPSSREACLILARELAFGMDARTIDLLSHVTILLVPSINADGRANNTRGNSRGQDLNRDHSLLRERETFGYAEMLRDYAPGAGFDGHEFGNNNAGDLPTLPPRHQNVAQSIFDESQNMIVGSLYAAGATDGWWFCPYGCQGGGAVGLSEETILRNAAGLKNTVNSLLEARSAGGTTRPNEGNTQNNRRRKTYSAIWTYQTFFDYFRTNTDRIYQARADAIAFQISNTGRIVFRGSRPIPAFPAPHPGEAPPPIDAPTPANILNDPPCGYLVTEAQYGLPRTDGETTAGERMIAHGWTIDDRPAGRIVRMSQPQRGLIPLLLDDQAAEELLDGVRLYECPWAEVAPTAESVSIVEGTSTTTTLTIDNLAVRAGEDLDWSITEAASDCASPSDLGWLGASATSGTTGPDGTTSVDLTFDATGLTAPSAFDGLVCVTTNDAGAPVIAVPVHLQLLYPFGGFLAPIGSGLNVVTAGSNVPVKFRLGGNRGAIVLPGYPVSGPVDCTTLEPLGAATPTSGSGVTWDGDKYQYDWKTVKAWKGSCRQLTIAFDDTSTYAAVFRYPS